MTTGRRSAWAAGKGETVAWLPVDALESGMTLASDLKGPDGNMLQIGRAHV